MSNLVYETPPTDNMFRAPGLPFLMAGVGPGTGARLLLRDGVVWSAVCFPAELRSQNAGAVPRPAGEPGNQTFIAEVPQDGCVPAAAANSSANSSSSSSAYAAAPLLARCHPAGRMELVDYALAGAVVGVSQNPLPAHYNVVLKNITGLCHSVLAKSCVDQFTPFGCFLAAMKNYTAPSDVLSSAGDSGFVTYGAAPADGDGSSGGGGDGADAILLAGLLAGIGGVLVLLAAVGGVLWVRRRRRDAAYLAAAQHQQGKGKGSAAAFAGCAVVGGSSSSSSGHKPAAPYHNVQQGNSGGSSAVVVGAAQVTKGSNKAPSSAGKGSLSTAVGGGSEALSAVLLGNGSGAAMAGGGGGKGSYESGPTAAKLPIRTTGSTSLHNSEVDDTRSGSSVARLIAGTATGGATTSGSLEHGSDVANTASGPQPQPQPQAQAQAQPGHAAAAAVAAKQKLDYDSVVAFNSPINNDMALNVVVVERDTPAPGSGDGAGGAASPRAAATVGGAAAAAAAAAANSNVLTLLPTLRGKGAFGRVVEGIYQGQRVAVKVLTPAGLSQELSDDLRASFRQEVEVLGRCRHENVVRLLAASLTPKQFCLVMELCECSLEKLIYNGSLMPLPKVLHIVAQVAAGLVYLHPTIMHRDLGFLRTGLHRPANVLINGADTDTPVAKLTDFGLARMRSVTMPTLNPEAGTPAYMAPECYDVHNNVITSKADVFSLGVLLWTCLCGREPWAGQNMLQVAVAITVHRQRLPLSALSEERCPPKLRKLIEACWEHDPLRRPAAAEVHKEILVVLEQVTSAAASGSEKPIPCVTGALLGSASDANAGDTSPPPPRVLAQLQEEQQQQQQQQQ
ncbi:hypothetical protein HYH02_000724 [Chlamydomonas schloesseri]|uniref:Protein kinase domain-containing protein n=1 Tax=Chlamydomonas schloesseri TaxID=2026947 RepID=A0A835WXB8_9CHLO|nr:hypothetical protein HYH02_000724 [Chlamydomonas schloesseri]|eukprot:KAG2454893.1 hypothetical protein HYH02_000724 [Chlamydomonas schloesseri]